MLEPSVHVFGKGLPPLCLWAWIWCRRGIPTLRTRALASGGTKVLLHRCSANEGGVSEVSCIPSSPNHLRSYIAHKRMVENPVVSSQDKVLSHEQCEIPTGAPEVSKGRGRSEGMEHYDIGGRIVMRPGSAYLRRRSRIAECGRLITTSRRLGVAAPTNGADGLRLWMIRTWAMGDGGDVTRYTYGGLG